MKDYQRIITELEPEVRACGGLIKENLGHVSYTNKSNYTHDAVTKIDFEVENRLTQKLSKIDPKTPIVGEEAGGDRTAKQYWLIDPIDGTLHFIRGIPFSTIMLALIENSQPIVSIIHVVAEDNFYYAIKGQGAFKNGQPIKTSSRPSGQAVALTEINLEASGNELILKKLASKVQYAYLACAGYEFTLVADGRAEARVCKDPHGKDYDFAPGALLVQEAGGSG